jgi:hypothetical protein
MSHFYLFLLGIFFVSQTLLAAPCNKQSSYPRKWKKKPPMVKTKKFGKIKLTMKNCLGAGSAGATYKIDGKYAIKVYYYKSREEVLNEVGDLKKLRKNKIPTKLAKEYSSESHPFSYIVKERMLRDAEYYCERGKPFRGIKSLARLLKKIKKYNLTKIGKPGFMDGQPANVMHDGKNRWYFVDPIIVRVGSALYADPIENPINGWKEFCGQNYYLIKREIAKIK